MSEEQYLTSDNVESLSALKQIPVPLACNPKIKALVQQLPLADMKRLTRQMDKVGELMDRAQTELVSRAIVNPDGSPVYTPEKVGLLKTGNAPLFASVLAAALQVNTVGDVTDELDQLGKN